MGGEIISLNRCKMLQINRTFFRLLLIRGVSSQRAGGGNTPSCAIRPSIALITQRPSPPIPKRLRHSAQRWTVLGQRGGGPTLGIRERMALNSE